MKKRVFYCERCNSPCTIYKKGKAHRVLICPNHGVLASNPLPLLALAAAPLIKKGLGMLGSKAIDRISSPKEMVQDATPRYQIPRATVVRQPILVDID